MKRYIINTWAKGLSVYTHYLPYPVPYLSCHNKSTIPMPVSSNSRVAKFIRETNIKDPLGVLYTLFHRNQGKKHKTPAQTHEKNYVQSIRTTCSSSWFHSIFYFQNCSTSHNFEHTRARHKLQLPRQRTNAGNGRVHYHSSEGWLRVRLANAVNVSLQRSQKRTCGALLFNISAIHNLCWNAHSVSTTSQKPSK